jgi:hypothetical protein
MARFFAQFIQKPKTIFLVDGVGALITASILFLVALKFQVYFSIPREILSSLSIIAYSFATYSILCFLFLKKDWGIFLKAIMITNLLYCCLTMGLVIYYHSVLTTIGLTYFLAEIAVIAGLVFVELKIFKLINPK